MNSRLHALQEAAKTALRLRVSRGYALDRPCDVYELIADSDMDLRFVDVPSLEGMYLHEGRNRRVCVCGRRPAGRQRFTAAHELGHCVLGHGSMIDANGELGELTPSSPEEHAADVFARYLLMPPRAVYNGFRGRGANPASPTPMEAYIVSSWLGVGYSTLVNHMALTLNLYNLQTRDALLRTSVKQLKHLAATVVTKCDVWLLDSMWTGCNRAAGQPSNSVCRLVFGKSVKDWTFTLNGAAAIYNSAPSSAVPGSSRLRDVQAAAEADYDLSNKLWSGTSAGVAYYFQDQTSPAILNADPSNPVTGVTFIGLPSNATQVYAQKGVINIAQAKFVIGSSQHGMSLPIAVSWSNRTELITKPAWKAQIGLTYNGSVQESEQPLISWGF